MCHGLDRSIATSLVSADARKSLPPGIIQSYSNPCRDELLKPLWKQLLTLLGDDGLSILSTLLLDCGLFVKLDHGVTNLRQLSGISIHDLGSTASTVNGPLANDKGFTRRPSEIKFVRHRMFYGKPSQNRQGVIHFGFDRIHVLNRLSVIEDFVEDVDLMRYVFPRQFKLHNVFTSSVDRKETTQQFKDYTTRDDEIKAIWPRDRTRVPRRLRGQTRVLIKKLRKMHQRCSYAQTLSHYCPILDPSLSATIAEDVGQPRPHVDILEYRTQMSSSLATLHPTEPSAPHTDDPESSFLPYTSSPDQVSAFCQSIMTKVVPHGLFGTEDEGRANWQKILGHIDRFVQMRKFESLSLHDVCQGLKVKTLEWLVPDNVSSSHNPSVSDMRKRTEILQELVFYVFDSLLIPLLRSNFYITESGIHRNRLLFYRHDVWERLCQPTIASLRLGSLVRLKKIPPHSKRCLPELGYSTIRFLPKDVGTRPIANLRRRAIETRDGKRILALSTNERLAHIFSIFNFERQDDRGVFRSDSFSLQSLGERLSEFKAQIPDLLHCSLYFVKVDIQSAFDSIPQEKLLHIVNKIFKHNLYYSTHHAEGRYQRTAQGPSRTHSVFRFVRSARTQQAAQTDINLPVALLENKKHVIFSDVSRYKAIPSDDAKKLLQQHIRCNVVELGRHLYRKTEGIAQGSVLSSLLCTFFYNNFEIEALSFLDSRKSLLLRIMDDFLLISTDKADALRFMLAMKEGDANHGIRVHPEKSLVNFDLAIDGIQVPKLAASSCFPFCGLFIDTATLQVSKNRVRKDNAITNSLTVDLHGQVGVKFKRRVLSSLRIQLQKVLLNRSLNDKTRIARTVVESVQETAMKMHQYYNNMPTAKRPSSSFLIETIRQLMGLCTRMVVGGCQGCDTLTRSQIHCLVALGMIKVLGMRNSHYSLVLAWLERMKIDLLHSLDISQDDLGRFVDSCFESVRHYRF